MTGRAPRWLPAALATLTVFAGGLAIGTRLASAESASPSKVVREPITPVETTSPHTPSDPDAPLRTPESAAEAAAAYVVLFDGPGLLDPELRDDLLDAHAADGSRRELGRTLGEAARLITEQLHLTPDDLQGPEFVWRSVPAGWEVASFTQDHAVVSIWGTGIVVARGQPLVQPGWRTTDVELLWERAAWRLQGFRSRPGPEPPVVGGTSDAAAQGRLINTYRPFHTGRSLTSEPAR